MGRYIELLAAQWGERRPPFDRVVLYAPSGASLEGVGDAPWMSVQRPVHGRVPLLFWEQVVLPRAARGAAMLFCPSYTCPVAHRGPLVVANHGIYEGLPGEFGPVARLRTVPFYRFAARRAQCVIANSRSTRADVVRYLGADPERVEVVHPAAAEVFFAEHDRGAVLGTVGKILGPDGGPFVLFVGKLSRRRNVPALIDAFATVRRRVNRPLRLLLVGPNVGALELSALAASHELGDAMVHRDHLDHTTLAHLYAAAEVFVLPTTHEGISWTMMEAMASGTPVLTVEHPALAEGGGDAVMTIPEPLASEIADGLERLLGDEPLRERLSKQGLRRARLFSWSRSAAVTMEILDRLALPSDAGG